MKSRRQDVGRVGLVAGLVLGVFLAVVTSVAVAAPPPETAQASPAAAGPQVSTLDPFSLRTVVVSAGRPESPPGVGHANPRRPVRLPSRLPPRSPFRPGLP